MLSPHAFLHPAPLSETMSPSPGAQSCPRDNSFILSLCPLSKNLKLFQIKESGICNSPHGSNSLTQSSCKTSLFLLSLLLPSPCFSGGGGTDALMSPLWVPPLLGTGSPQPGFWKHTAPGDQCSACSGAMCESVSFLLTQIRGLR